MAKTKLLVLSFIFLTPFSQRGYSQDQMILWQESTKLKWRDFQGEAKKGSENFAISSTGSFFDFKLKEMKDSAKIIFETYTYFSKDSSWSKSWGRSNYLLKHEQIHFSITELYTRKLRRALSEYVFSESYQLEIRDIVRYFDKERTQKQKQYDAETNHSINEEAQRKWNRYIADELKRFDKFKYHQVENKVP